MILKHRIRNLLTGCITAFEPQIIIELGINDTTPQGAKEKAEEIAKVIEIKLGDYLKQFPYTIRVKK